MKHFYNFFIRKNIYAIAFLLLNLLIQKNTSAQPGSLDPSFGNGGKVVTDFDRSLDESFTIAVQPDDKILVVGSVITKNKDFGLVRYKKNGALDLRFGQQGKVITPCPSGGGDLANSIIILPNAKIVLAGKANTGMDANFGLVRYLSSGKIDSGFGINGLSEIDFGGQDGAVSVVLQKDGKIVAGGNSGTKNFALTRLKSNGQTDSSFGNNGKVIINFKNGGVGISVALQDDEKILLAGSVLLVNNYDFGIARYKRNGILDSAFGVNGIVITDMRGSNDFARNVKVEPDGKIIVCGDAGDGLMRGTLDWFVTIKMGNLIPHLV